MGHAFFKLLAYREALPAGSPLLPVVNMRLTICAKAVLARAIASVPAGSPEATLLISVRSQF